MHKEKRTETKNEERQRGKGGSLPSCFHARSVILSYPGGLISRGLCTSLREGWHQVNPSPWNVFHEEKYEQDDSDGGSSACSSSSCLSLSLSFFLPPSPRLSRAFKSLGGTYSRERDYLSLSRERERGTEYAKIKIRSRTRQMVR